MGRPFHMELDDLSSTYEYANNYIETEIKRLSSFLLNLYNKPIFVVGSGGSYSVAKAFEYLHSCSQLPGIAKAVTPLEFSTLALSIHNAGVILITSNGNNNDTVNVYKFINRCCPISFLTLCLNRDSKIKKMTDNDSTSFIGDRLPRGKDGYLAVNSILAFIIIIARAYNQILKNDLYLIPPSFSSLHIHDSYGATDKKALLKESHIVLYSDFAIPVAVDIESKFSEAALGNILLADYRNFAHGRHFWLSERTNSTSIISLVTPENKQLYLKTLDLIPSEISRINILTDSFGVKGMLELFLSSFYLVGCVGTQVGIDPGSPKVPDFGKKMYHISHMPASFILMKKNDSLANRSAFRKCTNTESELYQSYKSSFEKFRKMVINDKFQEIILDYDSTLVEKHSNDTVEKEIFNIINSLLASGIVVKIATGRGKSVRLELKGKICSQYWGNVIIGYYNGGMIAPLSDDEAPSPNFNENELLIQLAGHFSSIIPDIEYELRPQQITIIMDDCNKFMHQDLIIDISHKYKDLKVLLSGHSIDIIPSENSKLNLLGDTTVKVLCIGDSGQYLGNDYELLSSTYSLSVNRVSSSMTSCWNYAPIGLSNTVATLYYLRQVDIHDHYFTLDIN